MQKHLPKDGWQISEVKSVLAAPFPTPGTIARLMSELRLGKQDAGRELVELCYPQLRRMAAAKMKGERAAHTWQPTALVNELYLELLRIRAMDARDYSEDAERAAFFAMAGQMMKRLLIRHSRRMYRQVERVEFEDEVETTPNPEVLQEVEDALTRLAALDPRFRTVVEMKVFEGLTGEEIARELDCSPRTVANCWNFARHWLQKEWAGKLQP